MHHRRSSWFFDWCGQSDNNNNNNSSSNNRRGSFIEWLFNGVILVLAMALCAMMYLTWIRINQTEYAWSVVPISDEQRALENTLAESPQPVHEVVRETREPWEPHESFYRPGRPRHPRTFCFVIGAEGTGSTWMSKALPADHKPSGNPARGITGIIHKMWSTGSRADIMHARKSLVSSLERWIPKHANLSVLHVSAPDFNANHYPDIHSSLWPAFYQAKLNLAIVLTVRDPAQAARSNHRRRWGHLRLNDGTQDIARSARSTEKHMTLLSEQVRALPFPKDVCVVSYHNLLLRPRQEARRLSKCLHFDKTKTKAFENRVASTRRAPTNVSSQQVSEADKEFLKNFFDRERSSKWDYLVRRASLA